MAIRMIRSSGKVFLDMEFPPAEAANLLLRSDLLSHLSEAIRTAGLTQKEMAMRLGVTQPRVSDIARGRIDRFSIDALVGLLDRLGISVSLKTQPRKRSRPATRRRKRVARSAIGR